MLNLYKFENNYVCSPMLFSFDLLRRGDVKQKPKKTNISKYFGCNSGFRFCKIGFSLLVLASTTYSKSRDKGPLTRNPSLLVHTDWIKII